MSSRCMGAEVHVASDADWREAAGPVAINLPLLTELMRPLGSVLLFIKVLARCASFFGVRPSRPQQLLEGLTLTIISTRVPVQHFCARDGRTIRLRPRRATKSLGG